MAPITKILVSALTLLLASPALSAPVNTNALSVRQLAGVGAGADSILTETDNGVGYGVEHAEDNTADNIRAAKGSVPKRQTDKIANGAANVLDAAGAPAAGSAVQSNGDRIDGQTTDDSANFGAQAGTDIDTVLEQAGTDTP